MTLSARVRLILFLIGSVAVGYNAAVALHEAGHALAAVV
jgi:hypothetical protein